MRTFGIWFFGLFASAIAAAIVGAWLDTGYDHYGWFFGMFAGLFGFAWCDSGWARTPKFQIESTSCTTHPD